MQKPSPLKGLAGDPAVIGTDQAIRHLFCTPANHVGRILSVNEVQDYQDAAHADMLVSFRRNGRREAVEVYGDAVPEMGWGAWVVAQDPLPLLCEECLEPIPTTERRFV